MWAGASITMMPWWIGSCFLWVVMRIFIPKIESTIWKGGGMELHSLPWWVGGQLETAASNCANVQSATVSTYKLKADLKSRWIWIKWVVPWGNCKAEWTWMNHHQKYGLIKYYINIYILYVFILYDVYWYIYIYIVWCVLIYIYIYMCIYQNEMLLNQTNTTYNSGESNNIL